MELFRVRAFGFLASLLMGMLMSMGTTYSKELSQRELRQLFPGTFVAYAYGVARISLTARADGTVHGKMGKADSGTWRVNGNVLCIKFKRWLKGRNRCSTVSKNGVWYVTGPVTFRKIP